MLRASRRRRRRQRRGGKQGRSRSECCRGGCEAIWKTGVEIGVRIVMQLRTRVRRMSVWGGDEVEAWCCCVGELLVLLLHLKLMMMQVMVGLESAGCCSVCLHLKHHTVAAAGTVSEGHRNKPPV
jgi:hypothetical protein